MNWGLGLLIVAILAANGASAAAVQPSVDVGAHDARCTAAAPPCGYIQPLMSMTLDNPKCQPTFSGEVDLTQCPKLLEDGATVSYTGTVRWYWKLSEDGTYPSDAQDPVAVTLGGTRGNVPWMQVTIEPAEFSITQADMLDPNNFDVVDSGGSQTVYFSYEQAVKVTVTRQGFPDATIQDAYDTGSRLFAEERVASQGGIIQVFARAYASASGAYFREAFATRGLGFDASDPFTLYGIDGETASQGSQASPAGSMGAVAALVVVGAAVRRRLA